MFSLTLFAQDAQHQSIPWLPDPLMLKNEIPVTTTKQWREQKTWIQDQLQQYFLGYMPPIPSEVRVEVLDEVEDGDIVIRKVELRFGRDWQAKMTVELYFPKNFDKEKPVFMTQWNHREWLAIGVSRGYVGCLYAGADMNDDTKDYAALYPDYNFAELMQRAWGATAVVTYLHTLPFVDTNKIAISGHSRNGKQSLFVAAFDERVDAVIPSSSGFGGVRPARISDRRFGPHTMAHTMTDFPNWFLNLKDYQGHEDKLTVDMNSLLAIIAPRPCLLNAGIYDLYGDAWGLEQTYKSAKTAYDFLKQSTKIQLRQRVARHTTSARDIEEFFDFLDTQFGIKEYPSFNDIFYPYDFSEWKEENKDIETPMPFVLEHTELSDEDKQAIQDRIAWLLGEAPPHITNPGPGSMDPKYQRSDNQAQMFRFNETIGDARLLRISPYNGMGNYLFADLYYPSQKKEQYPLVIYLHEYTFSFGYGKTSYPGFEMNNYIKELNDAGYAVLAFDMIGCGTRQAEATRFYQRYPRWSLMGRMVEDVQAAIDAAMNLPIVDTSNILLSGYALGAHVALFAAAMDDRITHVAVASPFTPFRSDNSSMEGIKLFYEYLGLIPRLGLFDGNEENIPVDLQEILAVSSAKSRLVISGKSRHIELDKMIGQIQKASEHKMLDYHVLPFFESFWLDHRQYLIDFMTEE